MLDQLSFQLKTKLQVNTHADLYLLKSETFCETMLFGFTKTKKVCEHNHFCQFTFVLQSINGIIFQF